MKGTSEAPFTTGGKLDLYSCCINDQLHHVYGKPHPLQIHLAMGIGERLKLLEQVLPQVGDVRHPVASFFYPQHSNRQQSQKDCALP